jgi:DNA modification methylase
VSKGSVAREGNSKGLNSQDTDSSGSISFIEVASFPDYEEIEHGAIYSLSLTNNTSRYTHSLHRFAAKYIPQVPEWAIRNFAASGDLVLDPFMGSGTTLVEGLAHGVDVCGLDIDPLARMISRAKTGMVSPDIIKTLLVKVRHEWKPTKDKLNPPMPDIANFEHWFSSDTWRAIDSLKNVILSLKCSDDEREFLLVVMSSTIRLASNADDQSHKTYVSGTLKKSPPDLPKIFWKFAEKAVGGLESLHHVHQGEGKVAVLEGEARSMPLEPNSCDLVVTSPPYVDSVDYMYNFMLEYFWLGSELGVPTRAEFNRLRKGMIGAKTPLKEEVELISKRIHELIKLDEVPTARKRAILSYFDGMDKHFREASKVLKTGGKYVLVVGNSKTKDLQIPIHDYLVKLADLHGLYLEKAFGYRIRRHYMKFPRKGRGGIILIDWVIILSKGGATAMRNSALPNPNFKLPEEAVAH